MPFKIADLTFPFFFKDVTSVTGESIVSLHNNFFFFLIIILCFVTFMLIITLKEFTYTSLKFCFSFQNNFLFKYFFEHFLFFFINLWLLFQKNLRFLVIGKIPINFGKFNIYSFIVKISKKIFITEAYPNNWYSSNIKDYLIIARLADHRLLEYIWSCVPALLIVGLFYPSFTILFAQDNQDKPRIILKHIGNQWFWTFEYSYFFDSYLFPFFFAYENALITLEEMTIGLLRNLEVNHVNYVPVHGVARFSTVSNDVIHNAALPDVCFKLDAVPGRHNCFIFSSLRVGKFYGQCSELCGMLHGFMPLCTAFVKIWDINWFLLDYFLPFKYKVNSQYFVDISTIVFIDELNSMLTGFVLFFNKLFFLQYYYYFQYIFEFLYFKFYFIEFFNIFNSIYLFIYYPLCLFFYNSVGLVDVIIYLFFKKLIIYFNQLCLN